MSEPAADMVAPIAARLTLLGRRIVTWAETCADYYAAAALYEQLRRLSDAELQRRGLSRETLARDVCARVMPAEGASPRAGTQGP